MAEPTSSDRPGESTDGPIQGQQGSTAPFPGDSDNAQAISDRLRADRSTLLRQLASAETSQPTVAPVASRRDLDREIDRARRTNTVLAVACVEVVGLTSGTDASDHRGDDALLLRVVVAIQSRLRSYDLVVRLGGDAFRCVMGGATIQDALVRFAGLQAALAADPDPCEIRVGVAALAPDDSAAELVTRAVAELAGGR